MNQDERSKAVSPAYGEPGGASREGQASQAEIDEFNKLWQRTETISEAELEEFSAKHRPVVAKYFISPQQAEQKQPEQIEKVIDDYVFKLAFLAKKLNNEERERLKKIVRRMPQSKDGFYAHPSLHKFEVVLNLYDELEKAGNLHL